MAGQMHVDTGAVLCDTRHLMLAIDRHPQLIHPIGQDPLNMALPQRKSVGMSGWKIADVQPYLREARDLSHLAKR